MTEIKAVYKVVGGSKCDFDFERIDLRRYWLVLGAIQSMENPTVKSIAKVLGFSKSTVQRIIKKLNSYQYPCLKIELNGSIYNVDNWGVVNPKIIEEFFNNYLKIRSDHTIIQA